VLVNKPLKEVIRDLMDEPIFELESVDEFEKWTVSECWIMTTHTVGKAIYQFHEEKSALI